MPDPDTKPTPAPGRDRLGLERNRDEALKPGRPPRTAYEPPGAQGSAHTPKTRTDPVTGEPRPGAPSPAAADETDGSDDQ